MNDGIAHMANQNEATTIMVNDGIAKINSMEMRLQIRK